MPLLSQSPIFFPSPALISNHQGLKQIVWLQTFCWARIWLFGFDLACCMSLSILVYKHALGLTETTQLCRANYVLAWYINSVNITSVLNLAPWNIWGFFCLFVFWSCDLLLLSCIFLKPFIWQLPHFIAEAQIKSAIQTKQASFYHYNHPHLPHLGVICCPLVALLMVAKWELLVPRHSLL